MKKARPVGRYPSRAAWLRGQRKFIGASWRNARRTVREAQRYRAAGEYTLALEMLFCARCYIDDAISARAAIWQVLR